METKTTSNPFSVGGTRQKKASAAPIPQLNVTDFAHGLLTYLEPQQIPRGAAADSLNWITKGSNIEIRRGYLLMGTRQTGSGRINGIFTAHLWNGTEILVKARGTHLEYYTAGDWTEIGSSILANEDISFAEYFSSAGAQLWVSSPNTGLLKIMTANMGSYISQYTSLKGYIKIIPNRMLMWGALGKKNILWFSHNDPQGTNYTAVTNETIGTGDGSTKTFSATLAGISGARTVFGITSGASNPETWTDDYMGNLTGSLGGTGTINYVTGAISLTFHTAPTNMLAIKVDYLYEDATSGGIADFTYSSPRAAGEGNFLPQPQGGAILSSHTYNGNEYVIHERSVWQVTISTDDTQFSNTIYRNNISSQYRQASCASSEGVYYVDISNNSAPFFAVIKYTVDALNTLPVDLSSEKLDLSGYIFDKAVVFEWNDYIVYACRTSNSPANNRMFLYNRILGTFDLVDFYASCFAILGGALESGDSATNNVFTLFSGFDDDASIPDSYWIGNIDNYGLTGQKKVKQLWIEGNIDPNQILEVYLSADRGVFVLVGTIYGDGSYVDAGSDVAIGQNTVGQNQVGGGNFGLITSSHFETNIKIRVGKFQNRQIKLATSGIGYVSINMLNDWDIRQGNEKLPKKYRGNIVV